VPEPSSIIPAGLGVLMILACILMRAFCRRRGSAAGSPVRHRASLGPGRSMA
jgi:hypothetical protein